jgi:hypothetical protein
MKPKPHRSGRTRVKSVYNDQEKAEKNWLLKNAARERRVQAAKDRVEEERKFEGHNYDDLMEFFDIMATISLDAPGFYQGTPFENNETYADNNPADSNKLLEYAKAIRLALSQQDVNNLLKLYQVYDSAGKLTYVATIDIPLDKEYVAVKFRISKV